MKNFLYLLTLTIISASCAKVEKTFTWTGEREVGAEGGTVVWTPNVEDPHHWPEFKAIAGQVYSEGGDKVIESEIFENPDLEVEGKWYKVTGKLNEVIIEFKSNGTPYSRTVSVTLDDPLGGFTIGVNQNAGI